MALQMTLFGPEPRPKPPARMGQTVFTEREAKSILTPATGMMKSYDYMLNPYRGCQFGCSYCYAAWFSEPEEMATWGEWVQVKSNAVRLLRRERALPGAKVYIGSATDPYQPVESKTQLTRSLLEVMAEMSPQPRIVIQTRSPLVVRDVDVLGRFERVQVNVSVPTDDDTVRKVFEPSAPSIVRRLAALKMLHAAGIPTTACVMPMLPLRDPVDFARQLVESRADKVYTGYFHDGARHYRVGTRPEGLRLARKYQWTPEKYEAAAAALKAALDLREGAPAA
ncbi:MAG: radical SAM protein [Fimbriimonadaceae bacterium]|nr:radical SAM protein [Fimbriimonadaceae bacterium]